jgi:toxin-antitoxin system PIN domain toxin
VILVDVNLLLYAYNADSPQHGAARNWLDALFDGDDAIGLPWVTLWGFIRLTTNPRVLPNPLPADQALSIVGEWLVQPEVRVVEPGPRHFDILRKLVVADQASGRKSTDAVLAALAMENGATLASSDHDFRRFRGLRWLNPLAPDGPVHT